MSEVDTLNEEKTDLFKINQNSTTDLKIKSNNLKRIQISFVEFSKEFGAIVFPGILFYVCVILVQTINLVYLSQTYKDEDMIKAISLCHLYFNSTVACVVHGLISSIDSLGSSAFAARKYRLLGAYIHKARVVGFVAALILVGINYLTFDKVLKYLNLNERVVQYCQEYIWACYIFVFPDIYAITYFRYINVIGKPHVNMVILLVGIFIHPINNYIFISVLDLAVTGAAICFILSRFFGAILTALYVNIWNPCPDSNFVIDRECFRGLFDYLKFAIGTCLLMCVEWWSMNIQAFIAIMISEDDYTIHIVLAQINGILININIGFNMACSILAGKYIVEHSVKIFKKVIWYSLLFGFLLILVVSSFAFCFREELFRLFLDKKIFYERGVPIMTIMCFSLFFDNLQSIMMGTLRGLGKNFTASCSVIIQYYLIMTVVSYTLGKALGFGVLGIWIAVLIGYATGSVFNLILYMCYDLEKIKLEVRTRLDNDEKNVLISSTTGDDKSTNNIEKNVKKFSEN